jgi:hypothetical protein
MKIKSLNPFSNKSELFEDQIPTSQLLKLLDATGTESGVGTRGFLLSFIARDGEVKHVACVEHPFIKDALIAKQKELYQPHFNFPPEDND